VSMRQLLVSLLAMSILTGTSAAASGEEVAAWTIGLRPTDFVIGAALAQLHTRRAWLADFDERSGGFEIALRRRQHGECHAARSEGTA
jgi:hypothetical protein